MNIRVSTRTSWSSRSDRVKTPQVRLLPLAKQITKLKPEANKFSPITKYLDEFDQAETVKSEPESTSDLREQFAKDFDPFVYQDASKALGNLPIGSL